MARLNQEAIETFMNITGLSETISIQKLEEHDGDLNRAINAYFGEGVRNMSHDVSGDFTQDDAMDIDDPVQVETRRPPVSHLSSDSDINPFSLLDPSFRRSVFDTGTDIMRDAPVVSLPRELRDIPIEIKDGNEEYGRSVGAPAIEDVTGTAQAHVSGARGLVTVDEDDDFPTGPLTHVMSSYPPAPNNRPTAPDIGDLEDYRNDIEEEMIKAAIEASKRDAIKPNQLLDDDDVTSLSIQHAQSPVEDPELARAVSLSLKTAEREKAMHKLDGKSGVPEVEHQKLAGAKDLGKVSSSNRRMDVGSSSAIDDDDEDVEEQPLVRHRSTNASLGSADAVVDIEEVDGSHLSPQHHDNLNPPQVNGSIPQSDEWGGISSEEHDEAVMLEAAMFGGIPEGTGYHFPYAPHHPMQHGQNRNGDSFAWRMPRPPSPSLTAQRLLREQQDDEYITSLQADREKEMKAIEEAEAASAEQRRKEEESLRKLEEEQAIEREITAKEASLPKEPQSDDENSVTLLVRMPDGSRTGRRFLKSDKLQYLFHFIDASRKVKPGTYRLVRPYPRETFGDRESGSTLHDLGLTGKQEALFLELI